MSIKLDGFDDIFSTMEQLGDVGKKAGKKAIKNGLEIALEQLKKDAPEDKQKVKMIYPYNILEQIGMVLHGVHVV